VGLVNRYDRRPKQRIKSCYRCNFAVTDRKAPAFLQGLLQFGGSLVGDGGLEPPTPCL